MRRRAAKTGLEPGAAAGLPGRLLDLQYRLGVGPVLLELVVVALGYGEDVDDHHAEVEESPVRVRPAFAPDRPHPLVAQPIGDAVGDGAQLALRTLSLIHISEPTRPY